MYHRRIFRHSNKRLHHKMSSLMPTEPRTQDGNDTTKGPIKCRIPQRLASNKKQQLSTNSQKNKGPILSDNTQKQRSDMVSHTRYAAKNNTRHEEQRPKSANRVREDLYSTRARSARPPERTTTTLKRPSNIPKKMLHETPTHTKTGRAIIMVPVSQKILGKPIHPSYKTMVGLPDQETIKKHEELELRQCADVLHAYNDLNEKESTTSRDDKIMQHKISWQEKIVRFENMKDELKGRQRDILELYATIRKAHTEMTALGEKPNLPSAEDLNVMNVSKLTPEQLLHLCSHNNNGKKGPRGEDPVNNSIAIDLNRIYSMPTKLVDTCEQTLVKRKEIIDWFESLKSQEKGISLNHLSKKINEFNAENDMLKSALNQVKAEFQDDLEEIIGFIRKGANETMALQLRIENLTYEMSELNSQNAGLRKQMHNAEHLRSQTNKGRVEELEKEVKDEKCKRLLLKDRLTRAEGQTKINADRATQLEAALEQARSQTWSLERTVQQLNEQNQKLQNDFDKELNKLTESIREHTVHLEEIASAREKLQLEKEDLEKKLSELSEFYKESLNNIKYDFNNNVSRLIETEKKYEQIKEEKMKLETQIESLCAQLLETELRLKDTIKQLEEKDKQIRNVESLQKELQIAKNDLEVAQMEIGDYRNQLSQQSEALIDIENNFKHSVTLEEKLKNEILTKDEYITGLEQKQSLLEQQLQENENKMEDYVEQLASLKSHITQLQEYFGEFDNLDELHAKINEQRAKLLEVTRQNGELAEALQKKDEEIEQFSMNVNDQEQQLEEREGIIKLLSEKVEEQTNIVKILRNNVELRTQADNELSQQLIEKDTEIQSLIANIETRKQQITSLEKIILTLEDQTRKASVQRKKDHDKIAILQKKIMEYEAYHLELRRSSDAQVENFDNLIKRIEDELDTPLDVQINKKYANRKHAEDRKNVYVEEVHEERDHSPLYQTQNCALGANIAMGNFAKKPHINDEQYRGDNLERKKPISIDLNSNKDNTKMVIPNEHLRYVPPQFARNLPVIPPTQLREQRKYKMFKLAGHRL